MHPISINMYRLDAGATGMPGPAFTSRTAIAAAELSTTVHVMAAGEAFSLSTHDVQRAAFGYQPSAINQASPAVGITNPANDRPIAVDDHSLRVHQPTGDKRPLSSFTSERHEPSPLGAMPNAQERSAGALQPATTMSSFHWPRVCQELSRKCADRLQAAVDALQFQASRSRSLIGIMGLAAGQGCTTTLLCLAQQLAARGKRVVLLDANFAAPRLAAYLGVEPATAWQDILERGLPVARAIVHSKSDRVDLLPLDRRPTNGPRLATGLQPAITAGVLLDAYDLVLVDLGAMLDPLSQATALELVRNMRVDAALAVTGPQPTEPRELDLVGQLLAQRGCELLGTIENRVTALPHTSH